MGENYVFSVVIPLYNKALSFGSTIESVLNQTFSNYEVIIVNDGSTDNTLSVAKKYASSKLRIINQNNEGVASARNNGINHAKGKYIALLDGDDLWDKNYLLKMYELIKDFPEASFFGCQFAIQNSSGLEKSSRIRNKRGYVEDFFKESLSYYLVNSSSIIIERICFDKAGIFNTNYKRGEDIDMWCRLARNYQMAYEPMLLSFYRKDAENRCDIVVGKNDTFFLEYNLLSLKGTERIYFSKKALERCLELLKRGKLYEVFNLIHRFKISFFIVGVYCFKRMLLKLKD